MSTPLTTARTMPTILRLEFDVVLVPERVNNVEDIGTGLSVVCLAQRLRFEVLETSGVVTVVDIYLHRTCRRRWRSRPQSLGGGSGRR